MVLSHTLFGESSPKAFFNESSSRRVYPSAYPLLLTASTIQNHQPTKTTGGGGGGSGTSLFAAVEENRQLSSNNSSHSTSTTTTSRENCPTLTACNPLSSPQPDCRFACDDGDVWANNTSTTICEVEDSRMMTLDELAKFRTHSCPRKIANNTCELEEQCPYSHCLSWNRRNPLESGYRPTLCPNVVFSVGSDKRMRVKNYCRRGRLCLYSHTKEEQMYHPLVYKTQLCRDWPNCRKHFCPFAHGQSEVRNAKALRFLVAEGPEKPENETVNGWAAPKKNNKKDNHKNNYAKSRHRQGSGATITHRNGELTVPSGAKTTEPTLYPSGNRSRPSLQKQQQQQQQQAKVVSFPTARNSRPSTDWFPPAELQSVRNADEYCCCQHQQPAENLDNLIEILIAYSQQEEEQIDRSLFDAFWDVIVREKSPIWPEDTLDREKSSSSSNGVPVETPNFKTGIDPFIEDKKFSISFQPLVEKNGSPYSRSTDTSPSSSAGGEFFRRRVQFRKATNDQPLNDTSSDSPAFLSVVATAGSDQCTTTPSPDPFRLANSDPLTYPAEKSTGFYPFRTSPSLLKAAASSSSSS